MIDQERLDEIAKIIGDDIEKNLFKIRQEFKDQIADRRTDDDFIEKGMEAFASLGACF